MTLSKTNLLTFVDEEWAIHLNSGSNIRPLPSNPVLNRTLTKGHPIFAQINIFDIFDEFNM